MKKYSIWKDTISHKKFPPLNNNITTDILIIGGGISGITTAYFLKDKNVTLIDKDYIGMGVTSNTTAKLTYLQDLIYLDIIKCHNEPTAYLYFLAQKEAIKIVTDIVKDNNIECNLEENKGIIFTNKEKEIAKIKKLEIFFQKYNIKYDIITKLPIKFPCKYGIRVNDTYTFNPLKYINHLKNNLEINIYEQTKAEDIVKENDYYIINCGKYKIKAKQVIITTHYPFFIKPFFIPFKTYISKSYVIASKIDKHFTFNAISNKPTYSLRYYNDINNYFLYSTISHPNSRNLDYEKNYQKLISSYQKYFQTEPQYIWSTHDIMTPDYLPYIGEIKPNMYLATGYNKWGMTNGTIAGKIISDLVNNEKNKFEKLFSLKRKPSIKKYSNYLYSNYLTSSTLLKNKLKANQSFYNNNVYITKINGKKVGIYIDENNHKHIVSNICPHFKCNLVFNNFDKTWDCPCHGSRFDIDGNLIEGPSKEDIKENKRSN